MERRIEELIKHSTDRKQKRGEYAERVETKTLSHFDQIRELAKYDASHLEGREQIKKYFISWWCKHYNRPRKDPILATYTVEELAYEYYDYYERIAFAEEADQAEADRIEAERYDDALAWADEEEAAEEAAREATANPTEDPENIEWMEEQMRLQKEKYGQDFGEDLEIGFEDE